MLQFFYNGIVTGSLYALLGASFAFVLRISGRLHVAYVATYAIAPYVGIWLVRVGAPIGLSAVGGLVAAILLGMAIERAVYQPVTLIAGRRQTDTLIPIFVASLGVTIVVENALLLFYGAPPIAYNLIQSRTVRFGGIGTTNVSIITIFLCWALVLGLAALLRYTNLGRRIRAVGQNPLLSTGLGIRPDGIRIVVLALTSLMAGVLGVLAATTGGATPTMGFDEVFDAFVVAFLAGSESGYVVIGLVALFLGQVTGGLGGKLYSEQAAPLVMFSILLLYLCARSLRGTRVGLTVRDLFRKSQLAQEA